MRRVRDFAEYEKLDRITLDITKKALTLMDVDELGLDITDRTVIEAIIDKFGGGPVGLETLAAAIGEEAVTIEDVYEPYLMQIGFLNRTPRGRCVTKAACKHLGYDFDGVEVVSQPTLFDT